MVAKSDKNLMNVSNLGVCFGPTLLRPEEETVASILDLKFYNIVVEILIDNYQRIFFNEPDTVSPKLVNSTNANDSKTGNNTVIYSTPNNHIPAYPPSDERIYVNNGQPRIATNYRGYAQPYTCVSKPLKSSINQFDLIFLKFMCIKYT